MTVQELRNLLAAFEGGREVMIESSRGEYIPSAVRLVRRCPMRWNNGAPADDVVLVES